MKWVRALWFLCTVLTMISCDDDDDDVDFENNYSDQVNCLPVLADSCFSDVYNDLACHLDPTAPRSCEKRDIEDLCNASMDALSCAQDIIDTSCKPEEGRNEFDAWMRGLQGIYNAVCLDNIENLKMLLSAAKCWNSLLFLKCVQEGINVGHVVDLLHYKLDLNRCSHLMIAMTTCNVKATNLGRSCRSSQDIINEAIHAFFTNTRCGYLEFSSADSPPGLKASVILAVSTIYLNFHLT